MYGIVARIPVAATASPNPWDPCRPRTNSPGLTYPRAPATDHRRGPKTNTIGHTMIVYDSA